MIGSVAIYYYWLNLRCFLGHAFGRFTTRVVKVTCPLCTVTSAALNHVALRTQRRSYISLWQSATMCLAVRFQHWRFRNAFTFKEEKGKNILVECNLCRPKEKVLSTSKSSTSNLKKHLEVGLCSIWDCWWCTVCLILNNC